MRSVRFYSSIWSVYNRFVYNVYAIHLYSTIYLKMRRICLKRKLNYLDIFKYQYIAETGLLYAMRPPPSTTTAWQDEPKKSKHGLRYRLRAYAEQSSIKCVPKMIRAKSLLHRVLWAASFVIGSSMAIYLLHGLWGLYFSYAVTLSVVTEEGAQPPFPDVTVCNLNPLWNSGKGWGLHAYVEGEVVPLTYDKYIMLLYKDLYATEDGMNSTHSHMSDAELYSASGFLKHTKHDDVILAQLEKSFIWQCVWESDNKQHDCVINVTITPTNGLCYTMRPPEGEGRSVNTRIEGLSALLFLRNINLEFAAGYRMTPFQGYTKGVKVLLHPKGTVPNMVNGFTVAPGKEATVVASYTKRNVLDAPYGNCQHDMKLDMFPYINAESVWNYTEHACKSLCYQGNIIEQCGCLDSTEITFDALTKRYKFCSIYSTMNPRKALSDINCTRRVKSELDAEHACTNMCPLSCAQEEYRNSINQVIFTINNFFLQI